MGYLHIDNLYKNRDILLFQECYALEKIHGTSAHIMCKNGKVSYFSGGEKYERFVKLFDEVFEEKFKAFLPEKTVIIYGEAYGGSQQAMSATYGKELKFIAFDVMIGDCWLNVPTAAKIVGDLGLEFVDYVQIPTNIDAIDAEKDRDSVQGIRNGMGPGKLREGIVLRPLQEFMKPGGEKRLIVKHKRDEFKETATSRNIETDPEKLRVLDEAQAIADEWVTHMRVDHVLDKFGERSIERTGEFVKAMLEDVLREASGEIVDNKDSRKAISKKAAALYQLRIKGL